MKKAAAAAGSVVERYCHLYYRWNWWVWAGLNAYAIGFGAGGDEAVGATTGEAAACGITITWLCAVMPKVATGGGGLCALLAAATLCCTGLLAAVDRGLEQDEEPPELTTLLPHSFFSLPDSMPESVACDPTKSKSALESPDEPELARVRRGQVPESVAASRGAEEAKDEG
uniref:Uncharacterized protein n=1 Tax=Glossina brevipalpis TaxID=37001 RepID=A0A1A9X0Y9_9MUSC